MVNEKPASVHDSVVFERENFFVVNDEGRPILNSNRKLVRVLSQSSQIILVSSQTLIKFKFLSSEKHCESSSEVDKHCSIYKTQSINSHIQSIKLMSYGLFSQQDEEEAALLVLCWKKKSQPSHQRHHDVYFC